VTGAAEQLEHTLRWAGISPIEGPAQSGPFGPYVQSKRLDIYNARMQHLLHSKCAYHCFCPPQRLQTLRAIALKSGLATSYDGACRNLSPAQVEEKLAAKTPYTIRLRVNHEEKTIAFTDAVYNAVQFETRALDDHVLIKVL
jgi:glutamyl/glutaminyl-tRNA synthetase